MATLTIKNVPEKLRRRLKESAAQHRRSVNSEVITCLEAALLDSRVDAREILDRAPALRRRAPRLFIPDKYLTAAKNAGRP